MRDSGLEEAIKASGGVASLARSIGIAQPSVSNWSRVPAERVLAVEALTHVSRFALRPDIYGAAKDDALVSAQTSSIEIDEVDQQRAAEYGLLALLLGKAPNADTLARIATLKGDASDLGMAHIELATAAADVSERAVGHEFFNLFIGVGRGEVLPYASYYLTGFLHERPLARVREDLARIGIARAEQVGEPEDHIAILCEVMAGLAGGAFAANLEEQARFFERHLKPWASRLFAEIEISQQATFYRTVGRVGRIFMELESEAFALS
jgi:TorA maturation chaperone TorD